MWVILIIPERIILISIYGKKIKHRWIFKDRTQENYIQLKFVLYIKLIDFSKASLYNIQV